MSPAIDTSRGRFYPWNNEKFISVTTALGALPKPKLNDWFVRNAARTAAVHREELAQMDEEQAYEWLLAYKEPDSGWQANLGSRVHSLIEKIAKGQEIREPTEEEAPFVKGFRNFLKTRKPEFLEVESTVYSRTHGYAGTLDAIVKIEDETYVVDTKTGKGVWPEAALQLAAYRHADFLGRTDGREDPIPTCSGGFVLHLRPTGWKVVPVATGTDVFDTFLSALDIFRWNAHDSGYAIGGQW